MRGERYSLPAMKRVLTALGAALAIVAGATAAGCGED